MMSIGMLFLRKDQRLGKALIPPKRSFWIFFYASISGVTRGLIQGGKRN